MAVTPAAPLLRHNWTYHPGHLKCDGTLGPQRPNWECEGCGALLQREVLARLFPRLSAKGEFDIAADLALVKLLKAEEAFHGEGTVSPGDTAA